MAVLLPEALLCAAYVTQPLVLPGESMFHGVALAFESNVTSLLLDILRTELRGKRNGWAAATLPLLPVVGGGVVLVCHAAEPEVYGSDGFALDRNALAVGARVRTEVRLEGFSPALGVTPVVATAWVAVAAPCRVRRPMPPVPAGRAVA